MMRMCCDCKWFNGNYKLCSWESEVNGKIKCVIECTLACKHYKKRSEI